MSKKLRELMAALERAGFINRVGRAVTAISFTCVAFA
jgi:hypothetical protein